MVKRQAEAEGTVYANPRNSAAGSLVQAISRLSRPLACWHRSGCRSAPALAAAVIDSIFGLIIAWVLVRYRFPGKALLGCGDRPAFRAAHGGGGHRAVDLAMRPTGWIGSILIEHGIKIAYTPWGVLVAMVFISLPFTRAHRAAGVERSGP